ncbi:MAG TPA: hypothetical protein VFB44_10765 [Thermoleophilaceae bacterium]|nr:hypothetical protein [Thermoleophilaceae bacterium]
MRTRPLFVALAASAAVAAGCGDDEPTGEGAANASKQNSTASLAKRHAQLERDPYALRCGDIRDKLASADITRIVQYALADEAQIRGLNRLQASQSIFFAITELCKAKADSYQPANDAIAGVRSGEFRARL